MCKINKKLFRSEKGDAVILLSIIVTGMLMLISAVAIEKLNESTVIQNVQKDSVDSLYKAEEGIEYSLYANKEKIMGTQNSSFSISVWENDNKTTGTSALAKLLLPAQNENMIVTSESSANQNNNVALKRTVFTNLPSRYYDQVSLWESKNSCGTGNCSSYKENNKGTYRIFMTSADFQKDGWDKDETKYRLVINCSGDNYCTVKNLKVGVNCDFTQCLDTPNCTFLNNVDLLNQQTSMSGKVILSDWFQLLNQNTGSPDFETKLDLRNSKIMVQFTLDNGSLDGVNNLPGNDIKMCKSNNGGSWTPSTDKIAGVASLEFKK